METTKTQTTYRLRTVKPHHSGFGMWEAGEPSEDSFDSIQDLLACIHDNNFVMAWQCDFEELSIEDISGRIYGEVGRLVYFHHCGGVESLDCYALIEAVQA